MVRANVGVRLNEVRSSRLNRMAGAGLAGAALSVLAAALVPGAAYAQTDTSGGEQPSEVDAQAEIIITARKRAEDIQDVPISVTAVTPEELRSKSINTIYDMLGTVPGLNVTGGGGGRTNPTFIIRGQGRTLGFPGVVQYFAEAPLQEGDRSGGLNGTYYDIESIQVLKGPQGTLFGRSSTGGAVLFSPVRPGPELDGFAEVTYGNYSHVILSGAVNIPLLGDNVAIRIAGNFDQQDGFSKSLTNGQELDDRNRHSIRIGLLLKPTDWLTNYSVFQSDRIKENGDAFVMTGIYANLPRLQTTPGSAGRNAIVQVCGGAANAACIAQRVALLDAVRNGFISELARVTAGGNAAKRLVHTSEINFQNYHTQMIVNNTEIRLGGKGFLSDVILKNIFSMTRFVHAASVRDTQDSPVPSGAAYGSVDYDRTNRLPIDDGRGRSKWGDVFSEEVQLGGKIRGRHDILLGFSIERTNKNTQLNTPSLFTTFGGVFSTLVGTPSISGSFFRDLYVKQGGFFGQTTIDLADLGLSNVKFTAGYRRSFFRAASTSVPAVFTANSVVPQVGGIERTGTYSENENSYNFSLDYKPVPNVLLYVTTRRGFKSGGINNSSLAFTGAPGALPTFGPELLTDYEIGAKTDWGLGGIRGRTNIALYRANLTGQQRNGTFLAPNNAIVGQIANAAKSRYQGLEIENSINFTPELRINIAYSYNDSKFLEYPGTVTNILGQAIPLTESPNLGESKHKLDVTGSYTLDLPNEMGTVTATANASYQSKTILSDDVLFDPGYLPQKGYTVVNLRLNWDNFAGHPVDLSFFVRNLTNKLYRISEFGQVSQVGVRAALYSAPRTFGVQIRGRFGASAD